MNRWDIYNATLNWKNCPDMRPWLIVGQKIGSNWECLPITGVCYGNNHFQIDSVHPLFGLTGLSKTCFIVYTSIVMVPESSFDRYRGKLANELLDAFKSEAGF